MLRYIGCTTGCTVLSSKRTSKKGIDVHVAMYVLLNKSINYV